MMMVVLRLGLVRVRMYVSLQTECFSSVLNCVACLPAVFLRLSETKRELIRRGGLPAYLVRIYYQGNMFLLNFSLIFEILSC